MLPRSSLGLLIGLIVVHILGAVAFANLAPYRTQGIIRTQGRAPALDIGAPDERQHVNYVVHLIQKGDFPVFDPKANPTDHFEGIQFHQPPAFYILAMGWTKLTGLTPEALTQQNQGQAEGARLRLLNALIGGLGVAGVFFGAWWGYRKPEVALVAATFAALLPMNMALSGAVSNDPLLLCLCSWTIAFLAKGIREGWSTKLGLALGMTVGVALVTKTTAVALLPALLLAALIRPSNRPSLKVLLAVVVPLAVIVGPWWLRNTRLYGDPLAAGAFGQAFGDTAQAKTFVDQFGATTYWTEWVGWWTMRSFVGVFGYMDIWLTNSGLPAGANGVYQIALLAVAAGFVGWLLSLRDADTEERPVTILFTVFGLIVVLLFIRFNSQYFQAQARYVLPAISPLAAMMGIGLMKLAKGRASIAAGILVLSLGLAGVFGLSRLTEEFAKRTTVPGGAVTGH